MTERKWADSTPIVPFGGLHGSGNDKTQFERIVELERDLAARDAELAAMKQGKVLADGMANMIRGFILKTVERETLDEAAAKYRKWEEDYCHSTPAKLDRAIAAEQRAEAAERRVQELEAGMANDANADDALRLERAERKAEEAASELQMRRTPLNAPADEELIRQSGIQLRHCSCSGGSGDEAHADDCPLWLDVLAARQWWRDRHVVAWSCSQEAKGGKMCAQWCGHQKYCTAHTRDDIEIAAIAAKGEA